MSRLFLFLISTISCFAKTKRILLVPFAGNSLYATCNASQYALVDLANNRQDVLPNFTLIPLIVEPKDVLPYLVHFEHNNATIIAPVYSGQDGGCDNVAGGLKGLNMIQISQTCSGTFMMSRRAKFFNNLYPTLGFQDTYKYAIVETIRQIGDWRQVGLIYSRFLRDISLATFSLFDELLKAGIKVADFQGVATFNDPADYLAMSQKARVIIAMSSGAHDCRAFLCQAYFNGMKPPLYAFIVAIPACLTFSLDASIWLPPNCTQSMIDVQISATFFIGIPTIPFELPSNSSIGLSPGHFDQIISQMLSGLQGPFIDTSVRYSCFDAYMVTILVLDQTEKTLNSKYNLSLEHWQDVRYKEIVFQVLNSAAAAMDFKGFRNNRIKYDKTGEMRQDLSIMQPFDGKPRLVAHLVHNPKAENADRASGYAFFLANNPIWATPTGSPPKDLSVIEKRYGRCNKAISIAVLILAVLISIIQILLIASSLSIPAEIFWEKWKILLLFGCCFMLNVSAVFHIESSTLNASFECHFRPFMVGVSLSLTNSLILAQLFVYAKRIDYAPTALVRARMPVYINGFSQLARQLIKGGRNLRRSSTASQSFALTLQVPTRDALTAGVPARPKTMLRGNLTRNSLEIVYVFMLCSSSSLLILTLWLIIEPPKLSTASLPISYDAVADSYFEMTLNVCTSSAMLHWIGVLLVHNAAMLVLGNILSVNLQYRTMPDEFVTSCQRIRVAAVNSLTLLAGLSLIFIVMGRQSNLLPCVIEAILSFGELAFSTSMGFILLWPKAFKNI